MSALTERVAEEHWLMFDSRSNITRCRCGVRADPDDVGYGDSLVAHIAAVTEAAVRAAVAADIRAEADTFMRVTLATYEDLAVKAYLDAARIAEGKKP